MSEVDFKNYLNNIKTFLYARSKSLYQDIRPLAPIYLNKIKENKEPIIKFLIPAITIGIGFYACNSSNQLAQRNISEIFEISDAIRSSYAERPDYWGLSTKVAIQENYVPSKFIKDDKIVLSNGFEVLIGNGKDADVVMPRANSFDMILPHMNKAQCISHLETMLSNEEQVKLIHISVANSSGIYTFEWGSSIYPLPIKKYASKNVCTDADNLLIWSIK